MVAVHFFRWMSWPQNVVTFTTVLPHQIYRFRGITVKFPPSLRQLPWLPRYHRFPHRRVILTCTTIRPASYSGDARWLLNPDNFEPLLKWHWIMCGKMSHQFIYAKKPIPHFTQCIRAIFVLSLKMRIFRWQLDTYNVVDCACAVRFQVGKASTHKNNSIPYWQLSQLGGGIPTSPPL